jgi:Ser/Thr protein kinase RdoA (MazF antagonist)
LRNNHRLFEFSNITTDELVTEVSALAARRGLSVAHMTIRGPVYVRNHQSSPSSKIFTGRSEAFSTPLAVKVFDMEMPDSQEHFDSEVGMLSALDVVDPETGEQLAPRLHLQDRDSGIVVMEWVTGPSLKSWLMACGFFSVRRGAVLQAAGRWLGLFHQQMEATSRPTSALHLLANLERFVEEQPKAVRAKLEGDELFTSSMAWLRSTVAGFDDEIVSWSALHGDCTPSNMIVVSKVRAVKGLDFGQAGKCGPAMLDVALFIMRTDPLLYHGILLGKRAHRKHARMVIKDVLSGYERVSGPQNRDWLLWCILLRTLERWTRNFAKALDNQASGAYRRQTRRMQILRIRKYCSVIRDLSEHRAHGFSR